MLSEPREWKLLDSLSARPTSARQSKVLTLAVTTRLERSFTGRISLSSTTPRILQAFRSADTYEVLLMLAPCNHGGALPTTSFSPRILSTRSSTFRDGAAGRTHIAILDWEELPTADEFVLLKDFFVARGVPTVICTPGQLEYEKRKLRVDAFRIDLVYKRVIIHELLARCDDSHPLIRAYFRGDVCLVNSFRCKMLHKKAVFELLTDEGNANWFTPTENDIIKRTVPWTRRVSDRKTGSGSRGRPMEHVRRIGNCSS